MKNCVVFCIAFLLMLPLVGIDKSLWVYFWVIPVIAYIIVVSLKKEKEFVTEKSIATSSKILKSILINMLSFFLLAMLLLGLIYLLGYFTRNNFLKLEMIVGIGLKIFIYACFFFLLVQNIAVKSLGHYFLKLKVENFSLVSKIKILLLNLYKFSLVYYVLFNWKFKTGEESNQIPELILLVYVINIASRLLVFKNTSLIEKIFGIRVFNDE